MKKNNRDESLKRLALLMAVNCVRNTCIEDFHARKNGLSDADMMKFNKEVANKIYTVLHFMFGDDKDKRQRLFDAMEWFYPKDWDEPVLDQSFLAVLKPRSRKNETR